jgi:phage tail protein X
MTVIYTTQSNDTLDLICFNHYGSTDALKAVLDVNPTLADAPALLPQGLSVILPAWQAPSTELGGITLW